MASTSSQASMSTSPDPQPTTTNSTHNNVPMGIFSLNGSPPLIAAFLGIGIFTVAMTIVFAWRKMNRGQLSVRPVRSAPRTTKKSIVLGEKPALWDFWTQREEGVTVDIKWENITPFSATLFCPAEPESITTKDVEPRLRNPPRFSSSAIMTAIRQYLRRSLSPRAPSPSNPATYELHDMPAGLGSSDLLLAEGSSIMMSFTIAMPFPPRKRDKTVGSETLDRGLTPEPICDTELGEYCIGSVEVLRK